MGCQQFGPTGERPDLEDNFDKVPGFTLARPAITSHGVKPMENFQPPEFDSFDFSSQLERNMQQRSTSKGETVHQASDVQLHEELRLRLKSAAEEDPELRIPSRRKSDKESKLLDVFVGMRRSKDSDDETATTAAQSRNNSLASRSFSATTRSQELGENLPIEIHDNFRLLKLVGSGSFSHVYAAKWLEKDNRLVAVKVIEVKTDKNSDQASVGRYTSSVKAIEKEVKILRAVSNSSCCLRMFDSVRTEEFAIVVTELCQHTLLEVLEMHGQQLPASLLRNVFHQMFKALASVHQAGIVHRDVKPDNFLCDINPSKGDTLNFSMKICDFGLAEFASAAPLRACCGTAPFMSPEMLNRTGYDIMTDMWSAGVVMYVLLFGVFPHNAPDGSCAGMKDAIRSGSEKISYQLQDKKQVVPRSISSCLQLLKSLLERRPANRPKAEAVVEDQWFSEQRTKSLQTETYSFAAALRSAKLVGAFDARAAAQRKVGNRGTLSSRRAGLESINSDVGSRSTSPKTRIRSLQRRL